MRHCILWGVALPSDLYTVPADGSGQEEAQRRLKTDAMAKGLEGFFITLPQIDL